MATTIEQSPASFSPAYNPLHFVISSNKTTEDSFQYVIEIRQGSTVISKHRMPARPDNSYCLFDASPIVESYLSHDLNYATTGWASNSNSYFKFKIRANEEYIDSGVLTEFDYGTDSSNIYAFNSALEFLEFVDYNKNDYLLGSSSKKFLTNRPSAYILSGQKDWLYLINDDPTQISKAVFKTYNSSGTLVNTYNLSATGYTSNTDANRFLRFGCGASQVISNFGSTALDNISYYTVQIQTSGSSALSEIKTFYIDQSCRYTPMRIVFLNKLGGFDAFNFKLETKYNTDIEKTEYKKYQGSFSGTSFSYSKSDRSSQTSLVKSNESVKINSDWLSESENSWLKELVTSPIVFYDNGSVLVPIQIQETKYEEKKKVNRADKLFNLQLSFKYSFTNYRQRY